MQIEVQVKEPMMMINQINQVSVKFDLFDRIKKAQQKDDQIAKIIEKVQKGKLKLLLLREVC